MSRSLLYAALVGLAFLPGYAAAQDKPTLVVRFASVDALSAKGMYLAKLVDEADRFDLAVDFLKGFTGKGGVDGLDPKKPFGLYAKLGPNLVDSEVVVLVPIKDEAAFVAFLKKTKVPVEMQKGGLYKVDVPGSPFPGYLRFANGYAYATVRDEKTLAPETLPKPETILPADQIGLMTAIFDIERVPAEMKKAALQALADQEQRQKADARSLNQNETEKALHIAGLELSYATMKSIVSDGGPLTFHFDANETKKTIALRLSLAAQPGTPLAKNLAGLGTGPSVAAGAMPASSIVSAGLNFALPEKIAQLLVTEADKGIKNAFMQINEPRVKTAFEGYYESLRPTLKAGQVDVGFALVAEAGGKHAMLLALKIVNGAGVEKGLKKVADIIPEADRKKIDLKLDVAKVGDVNIHSARADTLDANAKRLFGDGTFYSAIRPDAALFALGEGSLGTLKKAITSEPRTGTLASLRVNVAQLLSMVPEEQAKKVAPAFKKVFATNPDHATISLSVQGGKELKAELTVPDTVLQLAAEVRKLLMGQ